jgi:hypothetical protein
MDFESHFALYPAWLKYVILRPNFFLCEGPVFES